MSNNPDEELNELRRSAMNLFSNQGESLANRLRREVLPNIINSGSVIKTVEHFINKDINKILDLGSGAARIQRTALKYTKLILSQPEALSNYNPFEIRCCLCRKVISYPAWYYSIKYAVNHFHYFVCFDNSSSSKPTTRCYRREL